MKKITTWLRNLFFPPADGPKWVRLSPFFVSGFVFLVVITSGTYTWEYTNSPEFCGTGCHSMPPEYASYQVSPHAEIKCVECHIGREFIGNQFTRKLGDIRHVVAHLSNNYEFPIQIKTMRPADEICERCHNPDKFSDDSQRVIFHFNADVENTPYTTYLTLKTGGGTIRQGLGKGIHWHIQNEVYFYAPDKDEQTIPYVKVVNEEDGSVTEYVDVQSDFDPYQVNEDDLKQMDCVTCHNRITHNIPQPEEAVDLALERGLISVGIPEIRAKGVEVLRATYESQEKAMVGIGLLDRYYQENHGDFYNDHADEIIQAISTLKDIYTQSVFPDQKVDWDTHANNLGHTDDPGCFRCHDGNHLDISGQAIRLECNLCHSIPVIVGPEDEIVNLSVDNRYRPDSHNSGNWIALHRIAYDENDENDACGGCHEGSENYAAADNSSFCANSACHGSVAETIHLDGFEALGIFQTIVQQLPHYPASLTPISEWGSSLDDIHQGQEAMVCEDCHNPFPPEGPPSNDVCIACHGETTDGLKALTAIYEPNPHDGHEGEVQCAYCHQNFGPEVSPCSFCHEDVPLKLLEANE